LLRQWSRPSEGFFQCRVSAGGNGLVTIYNADGSQGKERLMFAVNPHTDGISIPIGDFAGWKWELLADHECFYKSGRQPLGQAVTPDLFIPALGCSLWRAER